MATGMRAVLLLTFLSVAGCGARTIGDDPGAPRPAGDAGAPTFPVGTWHDCAEGLENPNGNLFLNSSGFVADGALALAQDGATVTAKYSGATGVTHALQFTATTAMSASLAPSVQTASGFSGLCVQGIGMQNEFFYPAAMTTSAGTLSYDSGVVFGSLAGTLAGDGGACGWQSVPAAWWFLCVDGPTHQPIDPPPPTPIPNLPVGSYACRTQAATFYQSDGLSQYVSSGKDGVLLLTQAGAELTAEYSGDSTVAGTLHFDVTTTTTAGARSNQSLMAACEVPIGATGGLPPAVPEALPITAASLSVVDATVIVSFFGTFGASASCPGARKAGSLICTKP